MDWKDILIFILIILLITLLLWALFLWWQTQQGEEAQEEIPGPSPSPMLTPAPTPEEKADETATWLTHQIGGGPHPSYIKYSPEWFYKSIVGEHPGETYEMFVSDEDIENKEQGLLSGQARMIIELGPNNSPGTPLDDVIETEEDWIQSQHPAATFEKKTINGMKVLVSSYQEGGKKVRVYYLVKADATGFFTCEFLEATFIETFDKMIETIELGTIGIYE